MREIFLSINIYLFVVPVTLAISFVYAATRHENWSLIVRGGLKLSGMIFGLIAAATVVLLLINR